MMLRCTLPSVGMFSIACGARQNPAGKWVADDGTVLDSSDRQFLIGLRITACSSSHNVT